MAAETGEINFEKHRREFRRFIEDEVTATVCSTLPLTVSQLLLLCAGGPWRLQEEDTAYGGTGWHQVAYRFERFAHIR